MSLNASDTSLIVFITGCSNGGIGSAIAAQFAEKGCIVYASARSLSSLSDLDGDNIRKLQVDVNSDSSCKNAIDEIYAAVGRIDILVSNAGVACVGPLLDVSLDITRSVMDTNLYGTIRLVHLVAPRMAKRRKGLIIPVGSTAGELGVPFMGIYNASKAALHTYTETLALECRPLGVKVMLCCPGSTTSNISNNDTKVHSLPDSSLYKALEKQINYIRYASQGPDSMPRKKFAQAFVNHALSSNPPSYFTAGGTTTLWWFLKWLPRPTALRMIWNELVEKEHK